MIAAIAIAAFVMLRPSTASAVTYVQICGAYPTGFYEYPGTQICLNPVTSDARQNTPGGAWRWRMPDSPSTVVDSPEEACPTGRLVKFADITGSDLSLNSHLRYETTAQYPLTPNAGQYVMSVIYSGGFYTIHQKVKQLPRCLASNRFVTNESGACTAGNYPSGGGSNTCEVACSGGAWKLTGNGGGTVNNGNFCIYPYYSMDADPYGFPLGCVDTTPLTTAPATISFAASAPLPPTGISPVDPVSLVGANGYQWTVPSAADIAGTLSVWLCFNN